MNFDSVCYFLGMVAQFVAIVLALRTMARSRDPRTWWPLITALAIMLALRLVRLLTSDIPKDTPLVHAIDRASAVSSVIISLLLLVSFFAIRRLSEAEDASRHEVEVRVAERDDARERLDAALAAGDVGTWVWDVVGNHVFADPVLAKMFGHSAEQAQGSPAESYFAVIHEDDVGEVRGRLEHVLANALPEYESEFRIPDDAGGWRWMVARGRVDLDENGTPRRMKGVVLDIGNRKSSEEERERLLAALDAERAHLATVLANVPVGVMVADAPMGRIMLSNRKAEEILRQPIMPSDDLNAHDEWRAVHADGTRVLMDEYPLVRALASGEAVAGDEYLYQRGDGTRAWIRVSAAPVRDREGSIIAGVITIDDIDDQKKLELERARLLESEQLARAEAERTSRLKDEFLATLSHELRTPLNAILGWANLLSNGSVAHRLQEGLSVIERNARLQTHLIEDLLDMSRIISGKVRLDIQQIDPTIFITGALETVMPAANAKEIRVSQILDSNSGLVAGDANRLQQVLWNLLSNAIKFTPKGGRVDVIMKRINSHVEISVIDTGLGIDPEFLPHVFERFRQADASATRRHGGLGLGLAIVHHLVELHGGTITVQSSGKGLGTTFTVNLPVVAVQRAVSPEAEAKVLIPSSGDASDTSLSGVQVVVVDDEVDARDLIRRVLEDHSATVRTAASGAEALNLVAKSRPDLVISDIGMPEMDGYEFLQRLREQEAPGVGRLPAVALTAFARSEDRMRALRAGYLVHMPKPVEPAELVATVASITGRIGSSSSASNSSTER